MPDLIIIDITDKENIVLDDTLNIKEGKTGKENILVINKTVYKALRNYLESIRPKENDFLFASRKGNGPIPGYLVRDKIKRWTGGISV